LSAGGTVTDSLANIPPLGLVKIPSECCGLAREALDAWDEWRHGPAV
jgi:hypothetical protein